MWRLIHRLQGGWAGVASHIDLYVTLAAAAGLILVAPIGFSGKVRSCCKILNLVQFRRDIIRAEIRDVPLGWSILRSFSDQSKPREGQPRFTHLFGNKSYSAALSNAVALLKAT
jgi:hypothetical protein